MSWNKKCKKCGKEFHACNSCGLTNNWEHEYCSHGCWESTNDYIETRFSFSLMYKMARRAELNGYFIDLIDDLVMSEYNLHSLIEALELEEE